MVNENPYQQYQQNAVKSASRGELTLMLYNDAVHLNGGPTPIINYIKIHLSTK